MATHTFQIVVTQSGAQATAAAISQVGAAAQKSASALAFFRQALVVASTVRAAAGFVDLIDAATRIDNRLRVATNSSQEFARAQQFVAQISRSTRTNLESNAVTYGRLLKSTESLGLSSGYLEKVMTGLALSVKVGGATSMEARNAMIQFSQSLASGALRGDELRSVSEQLPALATAIGKEFGVSGGQLIAFAKANPGILETERVIKAVAAAVPELTEQAKKMSPTITEGFIAIHDAVVTMLGDINRGTGIFGAFSRGLVVIADNLNIVIELFVAFIAIRYAGTLAAWGSATTSFMGNLGAMFSLMRQGNGIMASFNAMFMLNPFTLWIAGAAAVVIGLTALYNYVPSVRMVVDNLFTTIGKIVEMFSNLYNAIANNLPAWATWENTLKIIGLAIATLLQGLVNLVALAIVPLGRAIAGIVLVMNYFGLATEETARSVVNAIGGYEQFVRNMLGGKAATESAGAATEQLTEKTKGLLGGLLGAAGGTDSAKAATAALAEEVKKVDTGYRILGEGLLRAGPSIKSSEDGFNNLARVTKDWEKYTTDAGTAVTTTAGAATAAKAPTDSLAGSMKGVNTQASGAAKASQVMASSMAASAESSTTAAKQVKEFADIMAALNPLMTAAKAAGEAAAQGFNAAGSAANSAAPGIRNLAAAYRELAAAKAASGSGGSSGGSGSGQTEARAGGGPVLSGNTYLVGEKGPELFTPNTTGNIIPNHALQSNGTTAANDNTTLIVRAINRMANAVVASNKVAAAANESMVQEVAIQTQNTAKALQRAAVPLEQSESFKGSGYSADGRAFENDPKYNWLAYGEGMLQQGQNYFAGSDAFGQKYIDPQTYSDWAKTQKVLGGDEAYRANMKDQSNWTMSGGYSGQYDANKPYDSQNLEESAKLAMLKASLERYGVDAFAYSGIDIIGMIKEQERIVQFIAAKSETATAALKQYRDAGENFKQFQEALPGLAAVASKVQDFQTLTPAQGGPMYGTSDPYGLANAPRPDPKAQEAMSSNKTAGAQDNRVQVQMTVNTPSAETFRQNKAQIESQLASMVDRANRRAGRR